VVAGVVDDMIILGLNGSGGLNVARGIALRVTVALSGRLSRMRVKRAFMSAICSGTSAIASRGGARELC
jgi:hypothetical protein